MADSSRNRVPSAVKRGGTGSTPTPANSTSSADDTSTLHTTNVGLHSHKRTTSNASPSDDTSPSSPPINSTPSTLKETFRTSPEGTGKSHLPSGSGQGLGGVSGLGIGGGGASGNSSINSKGVPPGSSNAPRSEAGTGKGFLGSLFGARQVGSGRGDRGASSDDSAYSILDAVGNVGRGHGMMGGKPVAKDFLENYKEEIKEDA